MILEALVRYYDILAEDPKSGIAPYGYSIANVKFALVLSEAGELTGILPLYEAEMRGKKSVNLPRRLIVPERVIRTVSIASNFLCDGSAYVLGISSKDEEDARYALQRYKAFKDLHIQLLGEVQTVEAKALLRFYTCYDPGRAREYPAIAANFDELIDNSNLVFQLEGKRGFFHDVPEIKQAWEAYKARSGSKCLGQCLVSGEREPLARLHTGLKGVRGAQSSGAPLVSFNFPAYISYGHSDMQGLNAPTSERAAFKYTTVLNHLLSKESHSPKLYIGDTTVVCWAESNRPEYGELFSTLFGLQWSDAEQTASGRDTAAGQRLREIGQKIRRGAAMQVDALLEGLDPNTRFYVLGLSPNAARVSVRFFYQDPFIKVVQRIMAHYDDLEIVREYDDQPVRIPMHYLMEETVSKKAKNKEPSPIMTGALMRAILNDTPYPAALYYAVTNRIHADMDDDNYRIRKVNYFRVAMIKAYLTRKYRYLNQPDVKEVLCMSLNEQSTHPAYLLGRLFAVLEKAQQDAAAIKLNATIKDRYFTSACASPASVFPVLLRLAQHHIAKAKYGYISDKRIETIMSRFEIGNHNPFPAHLSLDEQGIFVLGYYHQRSELYQPRAEQTETEAEATDQN